MKVFKFKEMIVEGLTAKSTELIKKLEKTIIKDSKKINGFKLSIDSMSGTFSWYNDYFQIFATPYWDGNNYLPINVMSEEGDEIEIYNEKIELNILNNEQDIDYFLDFYYKKIHEITNRLNFKIKLSENIRTILKHTSIKIESNINNVYVKEITSVNDIDILNLSDKDVKKIRDIIENKYNYIIDSDKYNL